jgi:dTDP-4-amino-4,6-dideoxygalactose transaminase
LLAAIGVAQLEKLDEIVDRRRELAHRYTDLLADVEGIDPPHEPECAVHNYQSYACYVLAGDDSTRDQLIEELDARNIESQIGTYALHRTDAFADAKQVGDLGTSAALEDNLLTLPISHGMTVEQQDRVVDMIDDILAPYR